MNDLLAKGRVPVSRFGPILKRLLTSYDAESREVVARRAGVHIDTIDNYIHARRESCEFDTADRLLCALDAAHLWWGDELSDIYYEIRLSEPRKYREHVCGRGHRGMSAVYRKKDGTEYTYCQICNRDRTRNYRARQREESIAA